MQPPAALTRYRDPIEAHLRSLLTRNQPPKLYDMLRYHMGWQEPDGTPAYHSGKRLRPVLCLLAYEATASAQPEPVEGPASEGLSLSKCLPFAAALELVHNFSLVHDDVQDGDATRHGRDTVWTIWGEPQAINAGDALLAIAHLSLADAVSTGLSAEAAVRASTLLSERTLEMVEGQVMDIEFEGRTDVSLEEYLAMISRKTGALFDASLALGAIAGGAALNVIEALGRCGRSLGIAFQVRDDMLGVWGAEQRTGKPIAADIRRRKKSLPVLYTLANSDDPERIEAIYGRVTVSEEDVRYVLRAMDAAGAQSYCAEVAALHRDAALGELARAGLTGGRADEIRQTAEFLLERDY